MTPKVGYGTVPAVLASVCLLQLHSDAMGPLRKRAATLIQYLASGAREGVTSLPGTAVSKTMMSVLYISTATNDSLFLPLIVITQSMTRRSPLHGSCPVQNVQLPVTRDEEAANAHI